MNKSIDELEAENEIQRCIASLRNIVKTINNRTVINLIHSGVPLVQKEAGEKLFDLKRMHRKTVDSR